ncbi:Fanconi anemia group J-like protein [Micractinium conductrix]|uniref:DNA 5'-3' helicase FANCJ n=1 Tax=Micractinium conductrix TaxID=554055 RepID=A0A2P6V6S0_9CHLO|nr:Fanconi anemia group J-like protein [Micractinium conductrix]|eukprot:PSC69785.1 Fanconi anemia group J-like protein [Micractinium conductrix]
MPQYTIGGCQVHFPHQAYGTQLSFMSKVIAALEGGHNALLEAPTGSGKTLSLLCSALAWQVREKQRIEEGLAAEKASLAAAMVAAAAEAAADDDPITDPDAACCGSGGGGKGEMTPGCSAPPNPDDPPPCSDAPTSPGDGGFMPAGEGGAEEAPPVRRKAPKIFYATRTHSQIAQVVKELKRSEFRPRMAVLGSRKHYCINQRATRQSSVDEACEELLKESQCQYFKNVHSFVNSGYQYRLHSIEDLKGFGKTAKACPYYTARKWVDEAEVIFAPYSYLLDPVIRRAMAVDVQGCMLIFDEAHNIEDVCREAASTEVELDTMLEVLACFHKAFELNGKQEVYGPLRDCAQKTVNWMRDKERAAVAHTEQQRAGGGGGGRGRGRGGRGGVAASRQDPYERLFPARQMMAELEACGLGPDTIDALWEAYQAAREEEEAMSDNVKGGASGDVNKENKDNPAAGPTANTAVRVGALALGVMSRLVQVVRMLHQGSDDGARDYRLVVQRQYEKEPGLAMGRYKPRGRGGEEEGDGDGGASSLPGYTFKLCLWSMNPAVAFRPVAEEAHSVVLTSGTLAPLEGFASELGTPFNITLEAPHVVDMRRQVWAGVVGTGPGGTPLIATFKNQVEPAFQDAVGRVILEAAAAVPDGLLVFMPSYSLLDRLLTRWKTTGALKQLGELKHVVQEPRGGGQDALKKCMTEYYDAVARGGGAVFFAVCRGKVSEGLDFADGNARGVIIVGIPFPAVKDLKVNEKKGFNDRNQRALNLVSGDTWYSQQAFRALNQALGRCIRHRLDWGAIMMVDERFKQPRNQKMLSRWVRGALTVHPTFEAGLGNMRSFFSTIQANPPGPPQGQQQQQAAGDPAEAAAIAAAVAAAVAAAGQAAPAPAPEQPAGRGVEGALHGTASQWGKNTAMGMLQMWQQKPLGQARVAAGQQQPQGGPGLFEWQQSAKTPPGGAAAAVAGMYAVKQEPGSGAGQQQQGQQQQGQQQQGQQLGALPAVKPEPQQWPAGAQQPQQHLPPPQQRRQSGAPPLPLQQAGAPLIKPEPQQWPAHLQHHQQHCGVKQEPQQWEAGPQLQHPAQQLQQQQQGKGPSPPHHEAAWQQHAPQQWQPVIGHHARPTSEDEGRGLPAGSAAALAAAVGEAPLAAWVCADVADCMAFLRGQGLDQPGMLPAGFSSLLHVAVGGVRDAFDAAREYLGQQRPLHHLAAEWGCALPRGLQAVLAAGPAALPGGKPYDQAALAYGQQRLRAGWAPAALVAAVSEAYSESLDALLSGRVQQPHASGLPAPAQGQVQHVGNKRGAGAEPDAAAKRRYLRGPNAEAAAQQRTAGADDGAAAALDAADGTTMEGGTMTMHQAALLCAALAPFIIEQPSATAVPPPASAPEAGDDIVSLRSALARAIKENERLRADTELQASELEAHRMRVDYLQRQLYKKKQAAAAPDQGTWRRTLSIGSTCMLI